MNAIKNSSFVKWKNNQNLQTVILDRKKEREKKPSIKTKAEKEPVSNIEEQVESKKKDDSPIESENEEN